MAARQTKSEREREEADLPKDDEDRYSSAIYLGRRFRKFRPIVEHPLFSGIFGRMVDGESSYRIATWLQASVPPDDLFGGGTIRYDSLVRRLYRFRAALPESVLVARGYLDRQFKAIESSIDVVVELDTLVRMQKDRLGTWAEREKDFPVPLEQVRREVETLAHLLEVRRETAIRLGLHPLAPMQPAPQMFFGGQHLTVQTRSSAEAIVEFAQHDPTKTAALVLALESIGELQSSEPDDAAG